MNDSLSGIRDDLVDRVKFGRIKPDEAEAEAKRLGLEPFARVPNPDDYDPLIEANWTLPMAINWIAHRTVEAVRAAWPAYRAECWHWIWRRWKIGPDGEVNEGWFLEQHHFPSVPLIELAGIVDEVEGGTSLSPMMTVREARRALWLALGEGLLSVTAIPRIGNGRVSIPPEEWPCLSPKDNDHRDELSDSGGRCAYADMLVPSKAMRHLWGPRREASSSLPVLMTPDGFGYMPLSCAAQWIATEGGHRDFDPVDEIFWREAFDKLLGAISSEKIRVVGTRKGAREPVPGFNFANIVVDYPYSEPSLDVMTSESVYLRCYPYIDDEHWRRGFDDALINRQKDCWTQLQVEKGDIRDLWPFQLNNRGTGAPGRPTKSMHLVLDEFERRIAGAEVARSLRDEADALIVWLKAAHPHADRPSRKTVENQIRSRYRGIGVPK